MNDFNKQFSILKKCYNRFDSTSVLQKKSSIKGLSRIKIPSGKVVNYMSILLFICSHPDSREIHSLADNELKRIVKTVRGLNLRELKRLENTGLPFIKTYGKYSFEMIRWMLTKKEYKLSLFNFNENSFSLNDILRQTLPSAERENTTAGMDNGELFAALKIKRPGWLEFMISQFEMLEVNPLSRDFIFDSLGLNVLIEPVSKVFSIPYNTLHHNNHFFQHDLLEKFEHIRLFDSEVPQSTELDEEHTQELITVIRNSLTLTNIETDPATYMDVNSIRLYELERGISIAIYGMTASRQLPFESYVGYTLFKNGFPAAYGGAWVFGRRALFGISIFEPYRGGESGFLMCQVLRLYRQVFGVDYFEVEPCQFSADMEDGNESGAFWFYYKYGFRPIDKKLYEMAGKEYEKFSRNSDYRSSKKTMQFEEDNIALNLGKDIPPEVSDFIKEITSMINSEYDGDRRRSISECSKKLASRFGDSFEIIEDDERSSFEETALFAEVLKVNSPMIDDLLEQLIHTKPVDLYSYQHALLALFKQIENSTGDYFHSTHFKTLPVHTNTIGLVKSSILI